MAIHDYTGTVLYLLERNAFSQLKNNNHENVSLQHSRREL